MRVDASLSIYHEAPSASAEFTKTELRRCRLLLRRLRFLEAKVRDGAGIAEGDGGASFSEWEIEATEWVLDEMGFLAERKEEK